MVQHKNRYQTSLLIAAVSGVFFAAALTVAGVSNLAPYFTAALPEETYGITIPKVNVTATTATISWETDLKKPVYATLYYKASNVTNYSSLAVCNLAGNPMPSSCTPYTVTLTNLTPDTTYDYYIELSAQNPASISPPSFYRTDKDNTTFRTIIGERKDIVDAKVAVVGTTATVTWSTPDPTDATVYFWPEDLTQATEAVPGPSGGTRHTVALNNLSAQTDYRYYVTSTDTAKKIVYNSWPQPFRTSQQDTTPPNIYSVGRGDIEQWAPGVNKFKATITWTTNESALGKVEWWVSPNSYGGPQGYPDISLPNVDILKAAHVVTIGPLAAYTIYNYRIFSSDEAGNRAVSPTYSLGTPLGTP